jgi:hypothetical protein
MLLLLLLLLMLLQGSTLIYAMLAELPEMNEKVSVVAHLGEWGVERSQSPLPCYMWMREES